MAASKKDIQARFHKASLDAYTRHGYKSYRDAERRTGVNYSTIFSIVSSGRVPTRGQVIEWAEGLEEPINRWLELAGYETIEPALVLSRERTIEEDEQRLLAAADCEKTKDTVSRLEQVLQNDEYWSRGEKAAFLRVAKRIQERAEKRRQAAAHRKIY